MARVTDSRRREFEGLVEAVGEWARGREDVRAAALVGSWARGEPQMSSDVDVLLLTNLPSVYVESEQWARDLGAEAIVRTQRWGVLTERRLVTPGGLEVDVGIASPSWASTAPVDAGTAQVLAGGLVPLHDPDCLLRKLQDAKP